MKSLHAFLQPREATAHRNVFISAWQFAAMNWTIISSTEYVVNIDNLHVVCALHLILLAGFLERLKGDGLVVYSLTRS
jgi:hypothetical protein